MRNQNRVFVDLKNNNFKIKILRKARKNAKSSKTQNIGISSFIKIDLVSFSMYRKITFEVKYNA